MSKLSWAAGGLALALATSPAIAGDARAPICTDRPGKGSAPCAAPKGMVQVEMGLGSWSLRKDRGSRERELRLGETAIKYGITDRMHVEAAFPLLTLKRVRGDDGRSRDSGFGDIEVRVKQELPGSAKFAAALYPYVKVPTASKRIGNGKVESGLVVPMSLALGETPWSLATSPKLSLAADGDGHGYHAAMAQNLALGVQATKALNLSAELWGSWDWDEATTRKASLGLNSAYRLGDHLQLDASGAFGLTRASPDLELSAGVSMRF